MVGLHLTRTADNAAAIDALASDLARDGGGRVGIDGLLPDLSRQLRRTRAPHPRLLGRKVTGAWTWEAEDRRDRRWWPQGITTSAFTGVRERHGHDVLMTTWYSKKGEGSRVSVVDVERRRYAHVLLVMPTLTDGRPGITPLKVHAGGIVWHGDHVHVAATGKGFMTCRTADLLRVPAGSPYETFGHRYVLPVRFAHRGGHEEGVSRLRFSFFSLDRTTTPPTLAVGEYGSTPQKTRRFARFALDPATGLPQPDAEGRAAPEIDERGEVRMQGMAVADGTTYVTASASGFLPGTVYAGSPGAFRRFRAATPPGPEDLVWWPETGSLWTVTEHPRRRWIVAMRRSGFGARSGR
ncbi:hypothetical protein ACFQ0K_15385 [Nocardioides caeni]|uniref:Uncharacterized protein n=1 Tax=Nocardioides caeni TaxID=574700 RepID=A0A4V4HJ11_9ACTN|nr:hypothetical protein [Nocardioides caeni]THV08766.1 hypothetical protein E9934_19225 [Nocardioides caeni]